MVKDEESGKFGQKLNIQIEEVIPKEFEFGNNKAHINSIYEFHKDPT